MNYFSQIFILNLLFLTPVLAQAPAELIDRPTRPSMGEIKALFEQSDINPFDYRGIDFPELRLSMIHSSTFAAAIAVFEQTFPGATFYELGRDSVFIGDAMDAFYLAIGQEGRVKRLDASAQSFARADWELVYDFMKGAGIDLDPSKTIEWPHVVFDTTSFSERGGIGMNGGASQSRALVQAGFKYYTDHGGNPADLLPFFNFISIGGAYGKNWGEMRSSKFSAEKVFTEQLSKISDLGFTRPFYCEMNGLTYTNPWHNYFGPFARLENGDVVTETGLLSAPRERTNILWEMFEAYRIMSTPEMRKLVWQEASQRGFVFPARRSREVVKADCGLIFKPD